MKAWFECTSVSHHSQFTILGKPRVAQLQQKVLNQNIQLEMCNEGKKLKKKLSWTLTANLKDHNF